MLEQARETIAKKRGYGKWANLEQSFRKKNRDIPKGIMSEVENEHRRLERRNR